MKRKYLARVADIAREAGVGTATVDRALHGRSHEEREIGFRSLVRSEFPMLETLDLVSGDDIAEENYLSNS